MGRRVHIHNQNLLQIQDYKSIGWKETCRFGDLVEMEEPELQRAVREYKTMLTKIKSGLKGVFKWKS